MISSASQSVCEFEKSSKQVVIESKSGKVEVEAGVVGKTLPLPPLVPGK